MMVNLTMHTQSPVGYDICKLFPIYYKRQLICFTRFWMLTITTTILDIGAIVITQIKSDTGSLAKRDIIFTLFNQCFDSCRTQVSNLRNHTSTCRIHVYQVKRLHFKVFMRHQSTRNPTVKNTCSRCTEIHSWQNFNII